MAYWTLIIDAKEGTGCDGPAAEKLLDAQGFAVDACMRGDHHLSNAVLVESKRTLERALRMLGTIEGGDQ